jgi:hypothetical protein
MEFESLQMTFSGPLTSWRNGPTFPLSAIGWGLVKGDREPETNRLGCDRGRHNLHHQIPGRQRPNRTRTDRSARPVGRKEPVADGKTKGRGCGPKSGPSVDRAYRSLESVKPRVRPSPGRPDIGQAAGTSCWWKLLTPLPFVSTSSRRAPPCVEEDPVGYFFFVAGAEGFAPRTGLLAAVACTVPSAEMR